MQDGEAAMAWVLFWLFAAITTVATFLITRHHHSGRLAAGLATVVMLLFIGLFLALQALLRHLGL